MLFTETIFFPFFLICFLLRWLLPGYGYTKSWLLVCSYFFYGCWDWRFLFLILLSTIIDFVVGLRLDASTNERKRKIWLTISLSANLGILGFFKYFNFFISSGISFLNLMGFDVPPRSLNIILPVGISFFTFQTMSYTIDIYRRRLKPIGNFRDFALFVGFFPQLVAGTIVRARDFLPQLKNSVHILSIDYRAYLTLFWFGYFKKACIADNIAAIIDPVFAAPNGYGAIDAALAAIGYSIQIYCDFSGYSDMAIALAGLLGFRLCLNFNAPYFATNIRDFWRRWHISLSSWLRDYLYISLGGNRDGATAVHRNLMITMLLGGLWHGANFTFIIWGGLHGAALSLHRFLSDRFPTNRSPILVIPSWLLTLSWVVFCFTLFRCDSLKTFFTLLECFGTLNIDPTIQTGWAAIFGLLAIMHWLVYRYKEALKALLNSTPRPLFAFGLGAAVAFALFFTPIKSTPFIYFQF